MLEIKLLPNSEVEIIGEISAEIFMSGREEALKEFSDSVELKGFRKGKIPENILIDHIGNGALLERMAILALEKTYPKILKEHKIRAIGRPEISITKMAENNPLGFKIKTCVLPEIALPDYKSIAKKEMEKAEEITVADEDVSKTIESIRKSKATKKEVDGKAEEVLPELSDEFAKSLGNFENMDALKNTIRLNIAEEKKIKAKEAKRMGILDKVAEKIEQEMPKYLIDLEKDKMMDEMKRNITQMGLKWEDYLNHIKKTEEELRKDWEADAAKRVKYSLVLEEITEKEKIEVPEEDLEKEVNAMIEYHKNLGQELDKERVKNYLRGIMKNERLFQALENQ
ncbi:hypothetical protein C4572_00405 [Candidatus Parcubacteria bacterium]|nr:MAG: hypothetical protein C4572_00405 [Candidatus Parcubacteria bacterium]